MSSIVSKSLGHTSQYLNYRVLCKIFLSYPIQSYSLYHHDIAQEDPSEDLGTEWRMKREKRENKATGCIV